MMLKTRGNKGLQVEKKDHPARKDNFVNLPVDALTPYDKNARVHSDEQIDQIIASIKEFGFTAPLIIDENNMILAGHGRFAAAKKMGLEFVPCIVLRHLSPEQKRAYVIADNRIAENAGWNKELLALELTELDIAEFNLSVIGFSDKELEKLLPSESAITDGMPELPEGEKSSYQQITFTLHNTQAEMVKAALAVAKKMRPFDETLNKNSNGNAIARVCEMFLENHDNG